MFDTVRSPIEDRCSLAFRHLAGFKNRLGPGEPRQVGGRNPTRGLAHCSGASLKLKFRDCIHGGEPIQDASYILADRSRDTVLSFVCQGSDVGY